MLVVDLALAAVAGFALVTWLWWPLARAALVRLAAYVGLVVVALLWGAFEWVHHRRES